MQRRKFLVGMGSLAAGGAAAMGTGAYDGVAAKRTVSVDLKGDAAANLVLDPTSEQAFYNNGQLELAFDDLNANARNRFHDVFTIENTKSEPVGIFIDNGNRTAGQQALQPLEGTLYPNTVGHPEYTTDDGTTIPSESGSPAFSYHGIYDEDEPNGEASPFTGPDDLPNSYSADPRDSDEAQDGQSFSPGNGSVIGSGGKLSPDFAFFTNDVNPSNVSVPDSTIVVYAFTEDYVASGLGP
ncbi:hypothetical protein VB773_09725 [Haloarculaceae archaeon H-GB2-1]|nr:hypothetical protein [Haloarculaceae archaeon H-GB2-1]